MRRVQFWGTWGLAVVLTLGIVRSTLAAQQADLERRVAVIEDVHIDRRVSVVETRLDSIEFLGKAILTGIVGQLVLQGLNFRRRRENQDDDRDEPSGPKRRPAIFR